MTRQERASAILTMCVIVGPGLVGVAAGGLQWWVVGMAWDRLVGCDPAESAIKPNRGSI
jgi:hypothetical protein